MDKKIGRLTILMMLLMAETCGNKKAGGVRSHDNRSISKNKLPNHKLPKVSDQIVKVEEVEEGMEASIRFSWPSCKGVEEAILTLGRIMDDESCKLKRVYRGKGDHVTINKLKMGETYKYLLSVRYKDIFVKADEGAISVCPPLDVEVNSYDKGAYINFDNIFDKLDYYMDGIALSKNEIENGLYFGSNEFAFENRTLRFQIKNGAKILREYNHLIEMPNYVYDRDLNAFSQILNDLKSNQPMQKGDEGIINRITQMEVDKMYLAHERFAPLYNDKKDKEKYEGISRSIEELGGTRDRIEGNVKSYQNSKEEDRGSRRDVLLASLNRFITECSSLCARIVDLEGAKATLWDLGMGLNDIEDRIFSFGFIKEIQAKVEVIHMAASDSKRKKGRVVDKISNFFKELDKEDGKIQKEINEIINNGNESEKIRQEMEVLRKHIKKSADSSIPPKMGRQISKESVGGESTTSQAGDETKSIRSTTSLGSEESFTMIESGEKGEADVKAGDKNIQSRESIQLFENEAVDNFNILATFVDRSEFKIGKYGGKNSKDFTNEEGLLQGIKDSLSSTLEKIRGEKKDKRDVIGSAIAMFSMQTANMSNNLKNSKGREITDGKLKDILELAEKIAGACVDKEKKSVNKLKQQHENNIYKLENAEEMVELFKAICIKCGLESPPIVASLLKIEEKGVEEMTFTDFLNAIKGHLNEHIKRAKIDGEEKKDKEEFIRVLKQSAKQLEDGLLVKFKSSHTMDGFKKKYKNVESSIRKISSIGKSSAGDYISTKEKLANLTKLVFELLGEENPLAEYIIPDNSTRV